MGRSSWVRGQSSSYGLPFPIAWSGDTASSFLRSLRWILSSEALGAGTCAIGAYDQDKMDALLGVDGKDELVIYVAPVGRV